MIGLVLILVESVLQHVLILSSILKVLSRYTSPHLVCSSAIDERSLLLMLDRAYEIITGEDISSHPVLDVFQINDFSTLI